MAPSPFIESRDVDTFHFIIPIAIFLVITLASVLCVRTPSGGVGSLVKRFETAATKVAQTGPKPQIPDPFQVIRNGKPVNGNFVSQRSKVTGKMQWEKCKTPLY